jgi:hypothetical protein
MISRNFSRRLERLEARFTPTSPEVVEVLIVSSATASVMSRHLLGANSPACMTLRASRLTEYLQPGGLDRSLAMPAARELESLPITPHNGHLLARSRRKLTLAQHGSPLLLVHQLH